MNAVLIKTTKTNAIFVKKKKKRSREECFIATSVDFIVTLNVPSLKISFQNFQKMKLQSLNVVIAL